MTLDALSGINWLAVIVATIVYFALGALWYSPVAFGKQWQRAIGWDEAQQQGGTSPMVYAGPALFALVSTIATAMLANATGSTDLNSGVVLGLVVGIGYGLALTAYEALFAPNRPAPWVWFVITGSYHLIGLLIAAVIVSAWR